MIKRAEGLYGSYVESNFESDEPIVRLADDLSAAKVTRNLTESVKTVDGESRTLRVFQTIELVVAPGNPWLVTKEISVLRPISE